MTTNKQYVELFNAQGEILSEAIESFARDFDIRIDAAELIAQEVIRAKSARIRRFTRGAFRGIEVSGIVTSWGQTYRSGKEFMLNSDGEVFAVWK